MGSRGSRRRRIVWREYIRLNREDIGRKEVSAEEFFAQIDPSGNSSFLMGNSGLKSSSKTQTSQCVSLLNNTVKNMH